jgi:undecaprenyl-diphosphatase
VNSAHTIGPVGVGLLAWLGLLVGVAIWLAHTPRSDRRVAHIVSTGFGTVGAWLRQWVGVEATALLGLAFGLGVAMLLGLGATVVLEDVLDGEGWAQLDEPAAQWLAAHREPWLTSSLLVLTRLGDPARQTLLVVAVCLVATVCSRSILPAVIGAVGGGGIGLVIVTAKHLVGRDRPHPTSAVLSVDGFSFPSGHAAGAAAVGTLCAWMLCRWVVHRWAAQVAVWASTVAVIMLIGFSRAYLGVHYVTDVLAGWLVGTAWTGVVIVVASWWSSARHAYPGPGRPGSVRANVEDRQPK